jgi:hypothetical protein
MSDEIWQPVEGFEGLYDVSTHGRVCRDGRFLRPSKTRSGHLIVDLRRNNRRKMSAVHRLVLEAFVGPSPPGTEGCHRDGDPTNNHLANLRWDTRKGNEADKKRHGTDNAGERHGLAKFVEEDIIRIREARLFGATQPALASVYDTSQSRISLIVSRKAWGHVQ